MKHSFELLAAVIAAFPGRKVYGRTRLQKSIRLLQEIGYPTDYTFRMHHYGPYTDEIISDLQILEHYKLAKETHQEGEQLGSRNYYVIEATNLAPDVPELEPYRDVLSLLIKEDSTVLELAATYVEYLRRCDDSDQAVERLIAKKGSKCAEGRKDQAIVLATEVLKHGDRITAIGI